MEVELMGNNKERAPLPNLPDALLLEVFLRLPWREVLRGPRAVCRKWRALALHPELWRRRALLAGHGGDRVDYRNVEEALTLLRLAPCLPALSLGSDVGEDMLDQGIVLGAACDTDCGVARLALVFENYSTWGLLRALRRQVQLGQLRSLTLRVMYEDSASLLDAVSEAGLSELNVALSRPMGIEKPTARLSGPPRAGASLSRLSWSSFEEDPALEQLLEWHSATLESVGLLRGASCRAVDLLWGCPLLSELALNVDHADAAIPAPVAARLVKLTLVNTFLSSHCSAAKTRSVLAALTALCSRGAAALQELRLPWLDSGLDALLPVVLRGLPALHSLHLRELLPSEEVLAAIASRLRLLGLDLTFRRKCPAGSASCRLPALHRLVRSHPGFHVAGLRGHDAPRDCKADPCGCCQAGLHGQNPFRRDYLRDDKSELHWSLYGHDPSERCELYPHSAVPCPVDHMSLDWEEGGEYAHEWRCARAQ